MGIEIALGLISLAVGVVGGVAQMNAANDTAAAQKKANDVTNAQQAVNSIEDQRQRVREDRVRRAQIIAQSDAQGTVGSSGEAGALGALDTSFGTLVAQSKGQSNSNAAINKWNQAAADASAQGNTYKALTNLATDSIDTFGTIFKPKSNGSSIFG